MADTEYEFQEYPKALYRDRQSPEPETGAWVIPDPYETRIVQNEDEELAALEDGWRLTRLPELADKPKAKASA